MAPIEPPRSFCFSGRAALAEHLYDTRHRLPAGLTGWAQVHGLRGDDTSLTERARFDNGYIEGWSLWLDVVILLRTVGAVIRMSVGLAGRGRADPALQEAATAGPCGEEPAIPRMYQARNHHGR